MLLVQTSIWIVLYPLVVLGFALKIILQSVWFLFNSPVDIWQIIGDALEDLKKELQ